MYGTTAHSHFVGAGGISTNTMAVQLNTIPPFCYLTRKTFWHSGGGGSDVLMRGANPGRIIVLLYEAVCVYICYCVTNKSGLLRSIFVRQSVYAQGMRHNKSNVHDIRRTMC